jgi:acyl-coenzyme A thioesterase PaaI-like protein
MQSLQGNKQPKGIDFSVDYLRSGRPEECFAQCDVVRLGGRVALVTVRVWQRSPELPIAVARGHFLLATRESAPQTAS